MITAVEALRRLAAAVQTMTEAEARIEEVRPERDDAIREALAGGVPYRALLEITGLSRSRLDVIRREGQ